METLQHNFQKMNFSPSILAGAKAGGASSTPLLAPLSPELTDINSLSHWGGIDLTANDPSDDDDDMDEDPDFTPKKNSSRKKRKSPRAGTITGRKSAAEKLLDKMTIAIRSMQKLGKTEAEIVTVLKQACSGLEIGSHIKKLESLISKKTEQHEETQLDIFSRIGAHDTYPEYVQLQTNIATLGFEDLATQRELIKEKMKHYREYLAMLEDAEKLVDLQFTRLEPEANTHKYLHVLLTQIETEGRAEFRAKNAF
jgi:hypothetical protein